MAAVMITITMSSTTPLLTIITTLFLLVSSLTIPTATGVDSDQPNTTTPYLSPSTFHQDYQTMLSTFKLHPYTLKTTPPINITASPSSPIHFFHSILLHSDHHHHTFLTQDPATAHLFYLPFPPNFSSRSLFREINSLRSSYPYWDRSLGADHVFLSSCSSAGTPPNSVRNVVELRKNAVQITCIANSPPGNFVPHKDVALPPLPLITHKTYYYHNQAPQTPPHRLGYYFNSSSSSNQLLNSLQADPDFLIDHSSTMEGAVDYSNRMMETSRFCLFIHSDQSQLRGLMEAMARGCVPVVISSDNHPIHDMPLTDVLRWQDMVVFVGQSVGPAGLKRVLLAARYQMMRELGMAAAKHLGWNDPPKPYDAFHMVMYQLWRRRHVVRYYTSQKK